MGPKFGFKAEALIEQGRVPLEAVNQLKQWSSAQKLPLLSDEQLVLFLLSCYNCLEATQQTIKSHFMCKSEAPELFFNRNVNSDSIQKPMRVCQISIVPARTNKNDALMFWRLQDTSYGSFNVEQVIKLTVMVGELLLYQDPPDGLIVVIDLRGISLMHITKLRIGPLRKFFSFVQQGYYCKIKGIHILNTVYFIDKILVILKPLMNKELYNLITFHPTNMNMEEFFQSYLPKDYLPNDYGGNLPDQKTLSLQTYHSFRGMSKFYQDEEEQIKTYKLLQK